MKEAMPIHLGAKMQKDRAEPDRGAIHEDEFPGWCHTPQAPQITMDGLRHLAAIDAALGLLDAPLTVIHERRVDKARPAVQDLDHLAAYFAEAPGLVGVNRQRLVFVHERVIKVDDDSHEARRENPDAAEIKEIDTLIRAYRVIAEMGVAMDRAIAIKGQIPSAKHVLRDRVARSERRLRRVEEGGALEPIHGEKALCGKCRYRHRHRDPAFLGEHRAVETHMRSLALIIELLAQPVGDLGVNRLGRNRAVITLEQGQHQLELIEIGLHRRSHIGILQLACELYAIKSSRPMHLAQGGGARRLMLEMAETLLPIGTKLARHAPLHEGPAHGRSIGLQGGKLAGILLGERVGDGGEKLRYLHERPL